MFNCRASPFAARALALVGASVALAAPARAQLAIDYLDGRLGSEVSYRLEGGANELVVFLPSGLPGPTPLALVEPLDTRFFDVGLDLLQWLVVVPLGPFGATSITYQLPPQPALAGVPLFAQAVSLGAVIPMSPLFGDLSNPTRFTLLATGSSSLNQQPLFGARRYHAEARLATGPLGSDQVFLSGGESPVSPFGIRQDWEIVDPSTEQVVQGGLLLQRRTRHESVVLQNGRVLLVGGVGGSSSQVLATAELYLPDLDLVQVAPPMTHARVGHTATVLGNGKVLVVGGFSGPYTQDHPLGFPESYFGNGLVPTSFAPFAELFDPSTGTWTPIPSIGPRAGHDAIRLGDGTVLIAGGVVPGVLNVPIDTDTCLRFDPLSNLATSTASLPTRRAYPAMSPEATGGALLSGGGPIVVAVPGVTVGTPGLATLRYDRVLGTWSSVAPEPTEVALVKIRCVRMPDGSVRYVRIECPDARIDPTTVGLGAPAVHFLIPGTPNWTLDGVLRDRRPGFTVTALDDRTRLLIAGAANSALVGGTGLPDRTLEAYPFPP